MAGLFDNQAAAYLVARPDYPAELYKMVAELTPHHSLAWDAGTGNGQVALGGVKHYDQVIATDISSSQLEHAVPHPRIRYIHTPPSLSDDEIVTLIGPEGSIDLITVAQAIHWFDLPRFYSLATRLLRKPGGLIAVWGYNGIRSVSPEIEVVGKRWYETKLPYWHGDAKAVLDGYKNVWFPFESVGLGSEGKPVELDVPNKLSFEGYLRLLRSCSAVETAKGKGVDLLGEGVVKEFEEAWGGAGLVRDVVYKGFMLVGRVKV